MKEIIARILKEKGLFVEDAPLIFEAMSEILEEAAQRLKVSEPYATGTIRGLTTFAQMVSDYDYFCENN